MKKAILASALGLILIACGGQKTGSNGAAEDEQTAVMPTFSSDSAFNFCERQCDFGPRTMNSEAHENCGQWIADKFREYGMTVTLQKADLRGYDGTMLHSTNIIASYMPERKERIMLCAHWDSRPWADNDPDEANHRKPVMAANDGASGVAVMMEIARLMASDTIDTDSIGIDFICFDAEDWGTPQWVDSPDDSDTWALGAQHWAAEAKANGYKARFGILLDMVGGQGARFYREMVSCRYARSVVNMVWQTAYTAGFGSFFPMQDGGFITDDHVPVNEVAGIPCIDIIPCYPDCGASSFGPTWHTVNDDMQHIDRNVLKAVGQTVVNVVCSQKQ